jgi:hypothetical protein
VLDGNVPENEADDASWYDESGTDDPTEATPAPGK